MNRAENKNTFIQGQVQVTYLLRFTEVNNMSGKQKYVIIIQGGITIQNISLYIFRNIYCINLILKQTSVQLKRKKPSEQRSTSKNKVYVVYEPENKSELTNTVSLANMVENLQEVFERI